VSRLLRRPAREFVHRMPQSIITLLAAGAIFLLGGLPAGAQDPNPLAKLDQTSHFAIELMMDSAVAANLPTRSLMSKALEGISKKAPDRKIVDAVRRQLGFLRTARATLGGVNDEELEGAASVLEAGANSAQLSAFKLRQKGRSDLQAFVVWADFLSRGVPKDDASSAISKLWRDGADDATFQSLWNNVQTDILQGLNPGTALQNRIRESPVRAPTTAGKPPEGL
jgi:hypothetical protein